MMTSRIIPEVVTVDGEEWPVRRAWPASRDRIAIEAEKNSAIRAGFLSIDRDRVGMFASGRDPKLPGLERLLTAGETSGAGSTGNRLISHRPGKRAVVRLADGHFAKCVRPSRAADIIAGQDRAEAFRNALALPNVLTADDSTVVLSALPGVELHDPGRLGADWTRAWGEALDAWALAADSFAVDRSAVNSAVHGSAVGPAPLTSLPTHSADSEARVLDEWRARAHHFLGPRAAEVDSLITEVRGDLVNDDAASSGERNWGPIHRDLHDKQIMWDPVAGPGLLDVDTACLGERELDLGNLRAHARWRTHQGIWTVDDAEVVFREISRVTSASGLDPRRVSVYERSTLLRLVCVYAFRPKWNDRTGLLLDAAR
ncbi:MAG: phosphotransferase [Brevibacterium sp.]|nr:phosphotransferase [Brevibacterium sp.]